MAKSFQSKFSGKCSADSCSKGGVIAKGEWITWNRRVAGKVYHVDCLDSDSKDEVINVPYEIENISIVESEPIETSISTPNSDDELIAILKRKLGSMDAKLDESKIIELIKKHAPKYDGPSITEIVIHDVKNETIIDMGVQHKQFSDLLSCLRAKDSEGYRLNVWLTGGAGSGKSRAAKECAKALGLDFYFTGGMDNPYGLSGYMDANGRYVSTPFRKCFEHGGVMLLDEVDSYSPNATLWLNAATANHLCAFPDGIIERHKDCVIIAAANTWGLGATNDYVGRAKMDAAFLDRFVQINWEYDEALESITCGNPAWAKRVQSIRARVKSKGIKVVISPRASYYGAALLASGMPQDQVESMTLRKAMTSDQWEGLKYA